LAKRSAIAANAPVPVTVVATARSTGRDAVDARRRARTVARTRTATVAAAITAFARW
jgi:hypothetical protein